MAKAKAQAVSAQGKANFAAAAKAAGANVEFRVASGEALPWPDATFDVVAFSNSLHHMPTPAAALAEAARALKPGGLLYVMEPVPSGNYHEATKLVNDETEVRTQAWRDLLAIGEKGLGAMSEGQLARYGKIERDPHGNLRMAEVDFGRMIKDRVADKLRELKLSVSLTSKDIGYELRCADPVAFDAEYTRNLGYGAVKFLLSPEADKNGVVITFVGGNMVPCPFPEMIDPATKKMRARLVDTAGENYEVARRYMIRLEQSDFDDATRLERLAAVVQQTPAQFRERFGYLVK